MPLYDYRCKSCNFAFEQLTSHRDDPEAGICPKCGQAGAERQIVKFRIGGQGDLRESTAFHGCHSALDVHDHGHSHGESDGGHKHGPGCGHGGHGDS